MLKSFRGKLLDINLTTKGWKIKDLNEGFAKKFLGGTGYACRYLIERLNKDTEPLSPENIIMIMTGPLNLTFAPNTGRWVVCSKSPYTGIWAESNCGSWFGAEIKKAGYDGLIITGRAEKPSYLKIINDEVELEDATELWGKGTYETTKMLKKKMADEKSRVACIGPAGENQVKFANIISEERAAGRTGMGAILGSKLLKGIVIKGDLLKADVAEPEKFRAAVSKARDTVKASFATQMLAELGTSGGMDMYNATGEIPIKYFSQPQWEGVYNISGATMAEKILVKNRFCHSCVIGCGRRIKIDEGEYKTEEMEGPEYETLVSFGSLNLNDNLESITHINRLCFDYGIDTISSGAVIACLNHHFEKGNIALDDLDGLQPKWGSISFIEKMLHKITYREGIGNLLADGSNTFAKKFNISLDEIATVNGMEVTYHDLRSNYGMAIAYGMGLKGPSHNLLDAYYALLGVPFEEIGIRNIDKFLDNEEMAEVCSLLMDYRALYGSIIMCSFCNPLPSQVAELIETAIGMKFGLNEVKIFGERIANLKRLFNIKMGLTSNDDKLPSILLKPFNEGGAAGKTPNFERLKKLFYEYKGWNIKTGIPMEEKLRELELEHLV